MMESLLKLMNFLACGLISIALIGAILSPRVHDGIVIKVGLCSMALGFGSIAMSFLFGAANVASLERALLMVNLGIAVVIFGYIIRRIRSRHALRRVTDWNEFDVEPHAHANLKDGP